jgi:hypothetical protein
VLQKAEMYITLPETVSVYMDSLWMKLKLADPAWSVFTVLVGIAAVVCFVLYVVRRIRYFKAKR